MSGKQYQPAEILLDAITKKAAQSSNGQSVYKSADPSGNRYRTVSSYRFCQQFIQMKTSGWHCLPV